MYGARIVCTVFLLLSLAVAPALANDAFHIKYRHEKVTSDGSIRSGFLVLNVYNTSGAGVQDVEARIEGPNSVTYDNHRIFLGNLADGQQFEVLDPISVPEEMVSSETADNEIVWTLEFTDVSGQRVTADVVGQKVE